MIDGKEEEEKEFIKTQVCCGTNLHFYLPYQVNYDQYYKF